MGNNADKNPNVVDEKQIDSGTGNETLDSGMAESNDKPNDDQAEQRIEEDPLKSLQRKYDELANSYHRVLADFDNFRKRTSREKAVMFDDGVTSVIEQLLPVIDNFERALSSNANSDDMFVKGVNMISRQLAGALDYLGIEVIEAVGKPFDPKYHNAVAHVEDENFGDNTVVEELQKGYQYKDKVIRPSMVKVAN